MERVIRSKKMNYYDLALYDGEGWHARELLSVSSCQNCYSVTKAFTAAAVGIARDAGLLSLDDKLGGFFAGEWPDEFDPEIKNVTVRNLLTHTMGLEAGFLFEADRHKIGTDDWLGYCLSKPLRDKPGEKFMYSNSTYYLLSRIVSGVSGLRTDRFLYERLFKPLAIDNYAWASCPMGETQGGTSLYLSTRDMAKLGALYLNKGVWDGARIFSEDWAERATTNQTAGIPGTRYGYGIVITDDGYRFAGAYNQFVAVRPDLNIVIAAHGYIENSDIGTILNGVLSER